RNPNTPTAQKTRPTPRRQLTPTSSADYISQQHEDPRFIPCFEDTSMRSLSRREFLHDSAALAAALAGAGVTRAAEETAKKGAANDQLRVAILGANGRGRDHVGGFAGRHNCIVATICDP